MMGHTPGLKPCLLTSLGRVHSPGPLAAADSISTSISVLFAQQLRTATAIRDGPRWIPNCYFGICCSVYLYGIPANATGGKVGHASGLALVHGAGLPSAIPHHSTFSKNRHGPFSGIELFRRLFEEVVARCLETGSSKGDHLAVDGSSSRQCPPRKAGFLANNWRR